LAGGISGVNPVHIKAIIWLRWRLAVNNIKRSGALNTVFTSLLITASLIVSVVLFVTGIVVGIKALPHAKLFHVLFIWDGLVLAFLTTWGLGLLAELQRSDGLSLDKLLHLPVSLNGAFLCNYLSSFISLSVIVFFPAMTGLSIAFVVVKGPAMLVLFPLIAVFLLLVSALVVFASGGGSGGRGGRGGRGSRGRRCGRR